MKRLSKITMLAIVMVLFIFIQVISVSAMQSIDMASHGCCNEVDRACSHEWVYTSQGISNSFIMKDSETHAKCYIDKYRCTKCGAEKSIIQQNNWVEETISPHRKYYVDLGHVHGQNKHRFSEKCSECSYSKLINLICDGPPCVSPRHLKD